MEIIAICSQKNRVTNATTTLNLGCCLVELGKKVLLVDLDSEANLTESLTIKEDIDITVHNCLIGENRLEEAINNTKIKGLDIIASDIKLANVQGKLNVADNKEFIIKTIFSKAILDNYDYVLINCDAHLNILTINALVVANSIIIPLEPSIFEIDSLVQLISTIKLIIQNYNKELTIKGVLLTRVDIRNTIPSQFRLQLKGILENKLFETIIHQNISIVKSKNSKAPINQYRKLSKSYREYIDLAKEVISLRKNHV